MELNRNLDKIQYFGYCIIDSIPLSTIEYLYEKANEANLTDSIGGLHSTYFSNNYIYRKEVNQLLINQLGALPEVLNLHLKPVFGNFMIKNPDPNQSVVLHADWTYVDERKYRGYNLWVPFDNISMEQGPIFIVPHSHKIFRFYRGPLIPHPFEGYASKIVENCCVPMLLKKGEAILFDNALIHYSPANVTNSPRVAASLMLIDESANLFHFTTHSNLKLLKKFKLKSESYLLKIDRFFYENESFHVVKQANTLWKNFLLFKLRLWIAKTFRQ